MPRFPIEVTLGLQSVTAPVYAVSRPGVAACGLTCDECFAHRMGDTQITETYCGVCVCVDCVQGKFSRALSG